jgi:hypothetical protein
MVASVPYHLTNTHNLDANGAASSIDASEVTRHARLNSAASRLVGSPHP